MKARYWNQFEIRKITGSLGTLVVLLFSSVAHAQYFNMGAMWQGPKLVFSVSPSSTGNAGAALALQPSVALTNPKGTVITNMSKAITLAAFTDVRCTTPAGGSLSATTNPVSTSSGVSAFAGVGYSAAATIYLKASAQGVRSACWGPIAVSAGGGSSTPWIPEPARLSLVGPSEITAATCTSYTISVRDAFMVSVKASSAVTVNLSGIGSGAFYSNSGCTTAATTATIDAGADQVAVYYKGPSVETNALTVQDAAGVLSSDSLLVSLYLRKLTVSGPQNTLTSTCGATAYTLNYLNADGSQAGTPVTVTLSGYFAGSGAGASSFWTASTCGGGNKVNGPITIPGTGPYQIWFKSASVENTGSLDATAPDTVGASLVITTVSALPTKLAFSGPSTPIIGRCSQYTVMSQNASSISVGVSADTTVNLSQSGSAQFFSDASCLSSTTSVVIPGGLTSAQVYVKSASSESVTLTAQAAGLTQGTQAVVVGSEIAMQIDLGLRHTCAVMPDQRAMCWGSVEKGELGIGTSGTTTKNYPVRVIGLEGVRKISAGSMFTCALLADQTVKCWGYNFYGEVGNGNTTQQNSPVAVSGLSGVSAISTGGGHACALLSDQTVKCWGRNNYGQLGNNSTTNSSTPVTVSGLTGVTSISTSSYTTCAVLSNQSVKCWGYNANGQVGNGTTSNALVPADVSALTSVTAVAVGETMSCALLTDQTVKCWGDNTSGQLGDGTTTNSLTPVAVSGLTGVAGITAGASYACARLSDQTGKCWGLNTYGQLGNGTVVSTGASAPTVISGLIDAVSIEAGRTHTCALLADKSAKCWGGLGDGERGDGVGSLTFKPMEVTHVSGAVKVRMNGTMGCALQSNNVLKCWGTNNFGEMGDPNLIEEIGGVEILGGAGIRDFGFTENALCVVLLDQTVKCSGLNVYGQLGNGTTVASTVFVPVSSLSGVDRIAHAWATHTCALLMDTTVRCWGAGGVGQLGNGGAANSSVPVVVTGLTGVTQLAVVQNASCALLSNGTVKCWGYNAQGQLGDGTNTNSSAPVVVSGLTGVTDISSGIGGVFCAILTDKSVKCWGSILGGSMGDTTPPSSNVPVAITAFPAVNKFWSYPHTCAILPDQTLWCVGANQSGQCGNGIAASNYTVRRPVKVTGLTGVTDMDRYFETTCAVVANQKVMCWGSNSNRKIGNMALTPRPVNYFSGQ